MHNAALAELGLDWLYLPLPLVPERFANAVPALEASGFRGINVTVPHKVAAHDLAHERTAAARAIGAANTLTFRDGEVLADNTDAQGFLDAIGEPPAGKRALVLGAGGSARAVVWALVQAGASEVSVLNRTPERAEALAAELGARMIERPVPADLLVNCTSLGLRGDTTPAEAVRTLGLEAIEPPAIVVDLVYGDECHPGGRLGGIGEQPGGGRPRGPDPPGGTEPGRLDRARAADRGHEPGGPAHARTRYRVGH